MDTIITTIVRETLPTLPPAGVERDLALRRAAELCAARAASVELDAAARRARDQAHTRRAGAADASGAIADVLSAASVLQQDGPADAAARTAARESLRRAMTSPDFLDVLPAWIGELRGVAGMEPGSGACTIASAMQLWSWTTRHFLRRSDCPESVLSELAEGFSALVAARYYILAVTRPFRDSSMSPQLLQDLAHLHTARTAGRAATLCAELVHGYRRHPAWDAEGCAACYGAEELDELEGLMPGIASSARAQSDVIEADGSHAPKAGPCVRFAEIDGFVRLRAKLDGCLTGARLAGDRAAAALAGPLTPAARS